MILISASDAELLALAAKANGCVQYDPFRQVFRRVVEMGFLSDDWRPLTDDSDALRLAVQLGMFTTASGLSEFQAYYSDEMARDNKPTAATRRAIVTIAAYHGLTLP
ncbi:hypothetical protein [Pseudomonas sp.]|uniref:hypothetical protein n=1 Tax=Pseudomonas sp. TaxID=306 RepID=UPI002ED7CA2E